VLTVSLFSSLSTSKAAVRWEWSGVVVFYAILWVRLTLLCGDGDGGGDGDGDDVVIVVMAAVISARNVSPTCFNKNYN